MSTKQIKAGLSKANVNAIAGAIGTATLNRLVPQFSTSVSYTKGQYTNYNNQLYRFTSDKSAGAWDSSKVESASLNDLINDVNGAVASVDNKANVDGNYQSMTVGLANNLDTKLVENDQNPYIFRATAVSDNQEKEVGSPCKVKKIVGGTIAWNQLVQNGNFADSSKWSVEDGTLSVSNNVATFTATHQYSAFAQSGIPCPAGHKIYAKCEIKLTTATTGIEVNVRLNDKITIATTDWQEVSMIVSAEPNSSGMIFFRIQDNRTSGWDAIQVKNVQIFDLTQMYGATIADYLYGLANDGGAKWFKKHFPLPYYAYNTGTLVSVKTSGKKITHFNQYDVSKLTIGNITVSGADDNNNYCLKSSTVANAMKVLPSTTYYLHAKENKTPNPRLIYQYDADKNFLGSSATMYTINNSTFTTHKDCRYIVIQWNFDEPASLDFLSDININFHYDGERDGEYEQYEEETYPIEDVELRGIPKLDANNEIYYDGDEYNSNGSVSVRYGSVDLGTLDWTRLQAGDNYIFYSQTVTDMNTDAYSRNVVNGKYMWSGQIASSMPNKTLNINNAFIGDKKIVIRDDSYSDATAFKTAMSGVYLVYELAEPTQSSATAFPETQECDNWGTEEYLAPAGDTRPVEVPVGHNTDYLPDLKAKVEVAPDSPDEDGVYVMTRNSGANSYSSLASWLASNGFVAQTDLSSGITDSAGLTYEVKKAYKTGNVVNLSIRAKNSTGSTISADTTLFVISEDLRITSQPLLAIALVDGTQTYVRLNTSSGNCNCAISIANDSTLSLMVSYAVA